MYPPLIAPETPNAAQNYREMPFEENNLAQSAKIVPGHGPQAHHQTTAKMDKSNSIFKPDNGCYQQAKYVLSNTLA